jgi:hypothetical protein
MNIADDKILVYESLTEVSSSHPYTILDTAEATRILLRFRSWCQMIETHRHLTEPDDQNDDFISLLTALADAVESARQEEIFPRIVLPRHRYRSIMALWEQAGDAMPEFKKLREDVGALKGW